MQNMEEFIKHKSALCYEGEIKPITDFLGHLRAAETSREHNTDITFSESSPPIFYYCTPVTLSVV